MCDALHGPRAVVAPSVRQEGHHHPPPAHADLRHPPAALPPSRPPSAFAIPHPSVHSTPFAPSRLAPVPPSALALRPCRLPWLAWGASPHYHAPSGREVDGALSRPSPKRNGAPNTCPDYCAFPGHSLSAREGSVRVVIPWNTRTPAPSLGLSEVCLSHPVCFPFLFSLQHPLFSSLFSRENSVGNRQILGSEPSLRLVWAQNQPNFRPNRQNTGNSEPLPRHLDTKPRHQLDTSTPRANSTPPDTPRARHPSDTI